MSPADPGGPAAAGGLDTQVGEAFSGSGPNAAHINTVLGAKGGPVETAWATALAMPRPGHAAFVTVIRPDVAVKPLTLFVNKAALEAGTSHAKLTWGAAQAGVASGVVDAVTAGTIPAELADELLLIAAVWVDPAADSEEAVFENNRDATARALARGARGEPEWSAVQAAAAEPANPFFRQSREKS
ncbi:MAG TPA: formaldehyde-activating enzyme [Acidimicrobiales bacterium]|nr:formaldehyde-activating enzyme [Acidimicrobiales bacterium]